MEKAQNLQTTREILCKHTEFQTNIGSLVKKQSFGFWRLIKIKTLSEDL